jgi:hypothetical protein
VSLEALFFRFVELVVVPFRNLGTVWGILPIYTSLILGEMYKKKVSFPHAVGNGFVMLWAGLNWARHLSQTSAFSFKALSWVVTAACIALGIVSIVLGLRRKAKRACEILGHTRFSCCFIIMLYPLQSNLMPWNWTSVVAILIFMAPVWFLVFLLGRLIARVVTR